MDEYNWVEDIGFLEESALGRLIEDIVVDLVETAGGSTDPREPEVIDIPQRLLGKAIGI